MVSVAPAAQRRRLPAVGLLPQPRGPITERLLASLRQRVHPLTWRIASGDANDEDDLHLALYCCYELHYSGLPGVDADWEWEPSLLTVRRQLEDRFLADLEVMVGPVEANAGPSSLGCGRWPPAATVPRCPSGWPLTRLWIRSGSLPSTAPLTSSKKPTPTPGSSPRLAGAAKAAVGGHPS